MSYKITDELSKHEFHQYVKEFFCSYPIDSKNFNPKMSFRKWIMVLANTEWELNCCQEEPLFTDKEQTKKEEK